MKWVSMAEQPHTRLRSPCAIPSVGWSGVKLAAIDESRFTSSVSANCNVWWRRNNGLGLFFFVRARPLSSSELQHTMTF